MRRRTGDPKLAKVRARGRMLVASEVAALAGLGRRAVYAAIARGELGAVKAGNGRHYWAVPEAHALAWVLSRRGRA